MSGNLALLNATMDFIKANPNKHDQNSWINTSCGTTMCFAGHAAALSGAEVPKTDEVRWALNDDGKIDEFEGQGVEYWAGDKLGMTADERNFIFLCMNNNNLEGRVKFVAEAWADGNTADVFDYEGDDEESEEPEYDCCADCG